VDVPVGQLCPVAIANTPRESIHVAASSAKVGQLGCLPSIILCIIVAFADKVFVVGLGVFEFCVEVQISNEIKPIIVATAKYTRKDIYSY
jgi:hypothetical protein